MDKKVLLMNSLAKIMVSKLATLDDLVLRHPRPIITMKSDGSPVTELDLALSAQIELLMEEHFPNTTFYSEEKFSNWSFPLLALDPLDGTREYIEGRDDWAISIGVFPTEDFQGDGWVYNPKTRECFSDVQKLDFIEKSQYGGEVSRSELKNGLFNQKVTEKFNLKAVGSIAYKLGRLSAGKSDFVVSLRPKNIWDIAGGTILCQKAGFKFYSQGTEVTSVQKLYQPPLLWCHEELYSELSRIFP